MTELKYRVPYADTDRMGIVYYANYLVYFERARNEILRDGGLTYDQLEKLGYMLPVTEAVCIYKSPARYDDMLTLSGYVEELRGARIKIACSVLRDSELLASGYTVHACVNSVGRPVRPPEVLINLGL
ncbi:MAG: hypothetical protein A2020_06925 [Lentisphaerae bacterium GWF2_45_14]|nr:MAG: hypothetical protein A2020_06925 [Lentisphaerae bacterium GWF2_45_14]